MRGSASPRHQRHRSALPPPPARTTRQVLFAQIMYQPPSTQKQAVFFFFCRRHQLTVGCEMALFIQNKRHKGPTVGKCLLSSCAKQCVRHLSRPPLWVKPWLAVFHVPQFPLPLARSGNVVMSLQSYPPQREHWVLAVATCQIGFLKFSTYFTLTSSPPYYRPMIEPLPHRRHTEKLL